ncbi:cobalt transporter [Campylobacter rectus]|nr:cobalt transporter [Campylobacter rectus]
MALMSRSDIISPKMKRNFKMMDFKDDKREKTMIKPRLSVYLKLILSV